MDKLISKEYTRKLVSNYQLLFIEMSPGLDILWGYREVCDEDCPREYKEEVAENVS